MSTDRNRRAPAFAPGEPEAPVAASTPPAPAEPQLPAADEDELAAVAAEEPEGEVGPTQAGGRTPAGDTQDGDQAAGRTPAGDTQDGVDLGALTAKAEKADEYLQLAQRTKADFENYRKRAIRDAAAAQDRGIAKLAMELLPAVDNLDRALEAAETTVATDGSTDADNGAAPLVSGIRLVHADVIAALARVGIEPFSPKGEKFDPQHHEAIAQQPVEGAASGTVVEVYQCGYRLGENVLRPARVVVAQ